MARTARVEPAGSKRKIRTGVALSPSGLCAADIRLRGSADRAWRVPLEAPPTDGGTWPSLATAFAQLARDLGTTQGSIAIALMPPLTEVRRLELPPLRDEEMQRLLTRSAGRYFVNARGPQLVSAVAAGRQGKGELMPALAAAAPVRLIAAIRAAAEQSGWAVDVIAPAESAWAAAAQSLWPSFARQDAWAIVAHEDRTELLQLRRGRLVGVRRFRAGAADASIMLDTVGRDARIGILGTAPRRRELADALGGRGLALAAATGEWSAQADWPDVLAAHFAGSGTGLVLRSDDAALRDRLRAARQAWMLVGAAAALIVLAAGVELWGVHRQLRLVEAERARIRPQIASTLVGRTTVEATYRHLSALDTIERSSPRWSAVIATLSDAIPEGAHLTAIRGREDSLVVDGLAQHAARVFDALEKTDLLVDVKAPAPVRREIQPDGTALDHFTIAARIAQARAPNAAPTSRALSSRAIHGDGQ